MSDSGNVWRGKPLNEVADSAVGHESNPLGQAGIELQRRTIVSLDRAADESARASQRLLVATWVIVGLTVVLVVLTIAIIALTIHE